MRLRVLAIAAAAILTTGLGQASFDPASRLAKPIPGAAALHWAAFQDDARSIERLLDRGIPVDAFDQFGRTSLMAAAAFASEAAGATLLARGADAMARDMEHGDTALHYAALAGHIPLARLLLDAGVSVNVVSGKLAATPLHCAAVHGRHRMIEYLLSRGANVDARDAEGLTPLQYASLRNRSPTVELLAGFGARPADLFDAINAGDVRQLLALLRGGANVNASDLFGPPLHHAAAKGRTYIASRLLDAGADLAATGEPLHLQALHVAALGGHAETARLLIDHGANLEARDAQGRTPLMIAATYGKLSTAEALLTAGANPYATDTAYGHTAIHVAAAGGYVDLVSLFVERGVAVNLASAHDGETPLHLAAQSNRLDMISFLVNRGADVDAADADGATPLRYSLLCTTGDAAYRLLVSLGGHLERT